MVGKVDHDFSAHVQAHTLNAGCDIRHIGWGCDWEPVIWDMVGSKELRRDGLSERAIVNHSSNQSAFGLPWTCIYDKQA